MAQLKILLGHEITGDLLETIDRAKQERFRVPPMSAAEISSSQFCLLFSNDQKLVAQAQLRTIPKFEYQGKQREILGLGGVIAHFPGKGHGRDLLMQLLKYHAKSADAGKSMIGFCAARNKGFYEKSGFQTSSELVQRFIFIAPDGSKYHPEEAIVFWKAGNDGFMEDVLQSKETVQLNRRPDW